MDSGEPEWTADGRAIRLIRHDPGSPVDASRWPATVPAVEQILCEGLELSPGVTVLVGENGSGKSTVVEMLAEAMASTPRVGPLWPGCSGPGTASQVWVRT